MKTACFYHLFASGAWTRPAREHVAAVRAAGLRSRHVVGITGDPDDAQAARAWLADRWSQAAAVTGDGAEQHTLALAWAWARDNPGKAVMYAHGKGSGDQSWLNHAWRESLTADVITRWRGCLAALEDGCDVAAPHWLDPAAYPNMTTATQAEGGSRTPYSGGNFWWARSDYLAGLPEPDPDGTRWDAERWIGLGNPAVRDLRPGWPAAMLFDSPLARHMLAGGPG